MRLEKYLADCGIGSRSQVKAFVKKGMVKVNDEVVKNGAVQITNKDIVSYLDKPLIMYKDLYFMFHKPAGCVCATKDNVQKTVLDYFPKDIARHLIIVGRLDKDTEGLLLLTDDGDFSHRLTSPGKHVDKTYYFKASGILPPDASLQVENGLDIGDDTRTRGGRLENVLTDTNNNCCEGYLTIHEGRYHQVKRMVQTMGCEVTHLKRLSIGPVQLDDKLQPGQYRELTQEELSALGVESRK